MNKGVLIKKSEALVLAVILAACLIVYLAVGAGGRGRYAELLHNNSLVLRLSLDEDRQLQPPGFPGVTLEVKNGAACFKASDCPDKVCVHTGYISHPGQSAVCLPNRLTLRIVGKGEKAADTYTN